MNRTSSSSQSATAAVGPSDSTIRAIVACLGASMTEAKGSFNWIQALEQRPENAAFQFCSLGVGGDLAYNGLQRLSGVVDRRPDIVIVLLGTNDVLALVSQTYRTFARRFKHIHDTPSPEWYRENLQEIVRRLKMETGAHIALCSLPPIGEDPVSVHPFQAELNRRVAEYNAIIREISTDEGADYIPFYERMQAQITTCPGKAFTEFAFLPFYANAFKQFVLGQSLDEIAHHNGRKLYVDGIHLTSQGGGILVDVVQEFLNTLQDVIAAG